MRKINWIKSSVTLASVVITMAFATFDELIKIKSEKENE